MSVMAFIPARGGSKGIPRKNLVPLGGKPLIQYTIEAAKESEFIDEIFVSSDDKEIIDFCRSLGVDVPYTRPAELASDDTPMIDAVHDALRWKREKGLALPESVIVLQPTSPLRNALHIDAAIRQFKEEGAESLISVHEMLENPYECLKVMANGWELLAKLRKAAYRRQDYGERFYFINGAIYLAKTEFFEKCKCFFLEGESSLFFMPPECGVDIDNEHDLKRAEFYLRHPVARRSSGENADASVFVKRGGG
ncbi:MAG: acylneuraminate cytidylyltransferase family protein [Deltaproteobacteria bacterium]|nr:acylneuraminate cytidylyltransferase family protein [Deltaproteobacteria bacterium]MBW2018607.1 acylneuraminate cytidylyltransferase family protein [Deltaproteobacteria bacterium]MBW2073873.1 acylneuraminate cytidylyltransferase family protein [Deltaproteobacteria bacterium]